MLDLAGDGGNRIVPLSVAAAFQVDARDPDPRGMTVLGADELIGDTVTDVWVDRSESLIRYLEVALPKAKAANGEASPVRTVLLPMTFSRIDGRRKRVNVRSILADQFAAVPMLASADKVTRREEDRICGYYGGGTLYATPARAEPML